MWKARKKWWLDLSDPTVLYCLCYLLWYATGASATGLVLGMAIDAIDASTVLTDSIVSSQLHADFLIEKETFFGLIQFDPRGHNDIKEVLVTQVCRLQVPLEYCTWAHLRNCNTKDVTGHSFLWYWPQSVFVAVQSSDPVSLSSTLLASLYSLTWLIRFSTVSCLLCRSCQILKVIQQLLL